MEKPFNFTDLDFKSSREDVIKKGLADQKQVKIYDFITNKLNQIDDLMLKIYHTKEDLNALPK